MQHEIRGNGAGSPAAGAGLGGGVAGSQRRAPYDGGTFSRRGFLRTGAAAAAAALWPDIVHPTAAAATALATGPAGRKPNIIVILADDLGYGELGVQGCRDIPTPHIDSIAKAGTRFTAGYVSCPVCSPTRAGLMTGRYQQRFGHEFNRGPATKPDAGAFGLPLIETTIAQRLRTMGYATGIVGKWHLGDLAPYRPLQRGFDEFYGFLGGAHPYLPQPEARPIFRGNEVVETPAYLTDAFGVEACRFINVHRHEPFFLYLAFNAVHAPMESIGAYLSRFSHIQDRNRRTFAAMMAALDDNVGRVLARLRDHRLENDTLVFFLSDNGGPGQPRNTPLRGAKTQVWEGGIRVPFLVQWPGHLPAGSVDGRPVISLDILPTAVAAAGGSTKRDWHLDGVNLLPYLAGRDTGRPHETLYWRMGRCRAIRHGDWKLLSEPSDGMNDALFDLARDCEEQKNLASSQPEKVRELTDRYKTWDAQLAEPLWHWQRAAQQPGNRGQRGARRRPR